MTSQIKSHTEHLMQICYIYSAHSILKIDEKSSLADGF